MTSESALEVLASFKIGVNRETTVLYYTRIDAFNAIMTGLYAGKLYLNVRCNVRFVENGD